MTDKSYITKEGKKYTYVESDEILLPKHVFAKCLLPGSAFAFFWCFLIGMAIKNRLHNGEQFPFIVLPIVFTYSYFLYYHVNLNILELKYAPARINKDHLPGVFDVLIMSPYCAFMSTLLLPVGIFSVFRETEPLDLEGYFQGEYIVEDAP